MIIIHRTTGGCPWCHHPVDPALHPVPLGGDMPTTDRIPPMPAMDATCPHCGGALWMVIATNERPPAPAVPAPAPIPAWKAALNRLIEAIGRMPVWYWR